jgi:uncharacterized protein YbjT (DUF2867 family)
VPLGRRRVRTLGKNFTVVTGAFGYSGAYITRLLLAKGLSVRTLTGHRPQRDPFAGAVEIAPFEFDRPDRLAENLNGANSVFNTYWIRFPYRGSTFERAVANLRVLIDAARRAGVRRFVHLSITGASTESALSYFSGKGMVERALMESGLSYAILRPALIFGPEDILLNNMAWLLRRFPLFAVPGNGAYRIQPVFVEDLAAMAVDTAQLDENLAIDAVGPEIYTFNDLVRNIAKAIGRNIRLIHVRPATLLLFAGTIGALMRDVTLTRDEISGLMADLLVSSGPPTAPTRFSEWLAHHAESLGACYASELARRS